MIIYLVTRLISSAGAFFYPGYASYKVLSQRPAPERELERWLMYWSVLGCIIGVEYVAEWAVSWIPFYYTAKTVFLLYLALPQTQGATYLYIVHLDPFLHAHEREIDAALAQMKVRAYAFVQTRVRAVWEAVAGSVLSGAGQGQGQARGPGDPSSQGVGGAETGVLLGLWDSIGLGIGPGVVATGAAMLRQVSAASAAGASMSSGSAMMRERERERNQGWTTPPLRGSGGLSRTESVMEKRRRLEAELAALVRDEQGENQSGAGTTTATTSGGRPTGSRVSSYSGSESASAELRERVGRSTAGRFEEVEFPSDAEGYDVGEEESLLGNDKDKNGASAAANRTSWFGWGSGTGTTKVKGE